MVREGCGNAIDLDLTPNSLAAKHVEIVGITHSHISVGVSRIKDSR